MSHLLDTILLGSVRDGLAANRFGRSEYALLFSMILLAFIPAINQLIVDRLVVGSGGDVLNIAGQIEWFDLFNETILAFLTVPMYFVLNKAKDDADLSHRINSTFLIGFMIYAVVSIVIYAYASNLTAYMEAPEESVNYLRLETIGFVIGYVFSYIYVVFVIRAKWRLFASLVISKIIMLAVGNLMLIPDYGVSGIAITNISVNLVMSLIAIILLHREGLIRRWNGLDSSVMKDWVKTGLFSGGQVLVANIVYAAVVMKMVNDVSEIGNYWLANNFIWGWLLVPITALGDMVRKEYYNGYRRIWNYLGLTILILVIWLISVPTWGFLFGNVIGMEDPSTVLGIVYLSVPFYVAYAFSVILQSVMISVGRTDLIFYECLFVNIIYYGLVYALYLAGVFEPSIDSIVIMFGTGLIVCFVIDLILYWYSKKSVPQQYLVKLNE